SGTVMVNGTVTVSSAGTVTSCWSNSIHWPAAAFSSPGRRISKTPESETTPSAASRVKVASWAEKLVSSTASSALSSGGTSRRNDTRSSSPSCGAGVSDHTVGGASSPSAAAGSAQSVLATSTSSTANRALKVVRWAVIADFEDMSGSFVSEAQGNTNDAGATEPRAAGRRQTDVVWNAQSVRGGLAWLNLSVSQLGTEIPTGRLRRCRLRCRLGLRGSSQRPIRWSPCGFQHRLDQGSVVRTGLHHRQGYRRLCHLGSGFALRQRRLAPNRGDRR